MTVKLFDSELKVMDVLWKEGDMPAKQISDVLKETTGWNMNTTYTVIKKCIAKGAIERREPNFLCHALIARDVVQAAETEELLHKLFDSSPDLLFASLLGHQRLSKPQIDNLRRMVSELEAQEENE
ncbi:MAG: BlaI/MecI/CopY family transcriptional regulator [Oscillospiraceae bacterium]|jgi:BlaI family penicillinase repressor|nr:BlaI/MecI/CopY family transcriptional regulator [Oscillospiraceae bacterium]MCI9551601.1 BlaI/MecI/CopY family transcriptional regulator [Oscillospiraceae bacterium]